MGILCFYIVEKKELTGTQAKKIKKKGSILVALKM
jgi:hypothetical protein